MFRQIKYFSFLFLFLLSSHSCEENEPLLEDHANLKVEAGSVAILNDDGTPFLWLGCTAWGMTEWMSREEVDYYLDDRKAKGMNVVQICLFWGKRVDNPTQFTANAPNHYGHKAFMEKNGLPDPLSPAVIEGGSPEQPNDYWDHVDYCLNAIERRGMYAAVLPFWGRRYVNAAHTGHSIKIFTPENIPDYGYFLGKRYGSKKNIIWVNGGDSYADAEFKPYYQLLAEGLLKGVSGQSVKCNEDAEAWDEIMLSYHPGGSAMINSSTWFQNEAWLDFNMIQTHVSRDKIVASVRQDLEKLPLKPTVVAEGHYEGMMNGQLIDDLYTRRQAWQSFFAGASGFSYGASFDGEGNGPLFSVSNNFKPLLNMKGAGQMLYLRNFLEQEKWWQWEWFPEFIVEGRGSGELEKLAVRSGKSYLVYFPENSYCSVVPEKMTESVSWYNPSTGEFRMDKINPQHRYAPPNGWHDGILKIQ